MQTTHDISLLPSCAYHLTPEQIRSFDENGYLVLKGRVSGELLRRLQEAGDRWIKQAESAEPSGPHGDYVYGKRAGGRTIPFRVNYLHAKGEPASLELLGSPEVLGIAESLAGPNFVPTYESMVFKMPGDGEIIPWHQDAVFTKRRFRIFNIDVYLDRATHNGGALRVIPKSQTSIQDVCALNDGSYDWLNGPHQIVEMEPGDVLVHDDMVLHGSPRTQKNPLRRVVYFEFRPIEQILEEGPWDATFADQRLRLISIALKRHQDVFPDASPFTWNLAPAHRPQVSADEATELKIAHTAHSPGSYCSADSK
jgi:ectoine hydroxylase-related dioxygenase (phytanoyl-CoA dioxygenase family)